MKGLDFAYLVIGQGLAGSLLAWRLLEHQQSVLVVDDGYQSAASTVAAGLINPMAGMRLIKTSGTDQHLQAAMACYAQLGKMSGQPLFHPVEMIRLFTREKQRDGWMQRVKDPAYTGYLGDHFDAGQLDARLNDPQGGFIQQQTGYLDTRQLLDQIKQQLIARESYTTAAFSPDQLHMEAGFVHWQDRKFGTVIFCEGWRGMHNRWFNWLPFQPARGEILTLSLPDRSHQRIINKGRWLLPLVDGTYKLGATNDWQHQHQTATAAGREDLLHGLASLIQVPTGLEVLQHQGGVRPATRDKMPFLGRHPEYPSLAIFNGFGGHGSLRIPWYAECLVGWLKGQDKLPDAVNINRFW